MVLKNVRSFWSRQPASVVIVVCQVLGFVALTAVVGHGRFHLKGAGDVLPQLFVIRRPGEVLLGVVATLLLVGASERRVGSRRTVLSYLVACAVAAVSAVIIHLVVAALFHTHVAEGFRVAFVPTYAPAVGTIVAASAFAGPLWRRRIRVLSFAASAAFVLVEGNFSGLVTLAVATAGLSMGSLLRNGRSSRRVAWVRSSHHEGRVLLSLVIAVSAGGLLVSVLGRAPVGPLADLGALFRDPLPQKAMSLACKVGGVGRGADFVLNPYGSCTAALARQGLHGFGALALGIAPLVVLLVAAFYIRRGLRAAAVTAIIVNALLSAGAFIHLLAIPDRGLREYGVEQATHLLLIATSSFIPLAIAVLLIAKHRHTNILSSRRSVLMGATLIATSAVILVLGYAAAGRADEDSLQQHASGASLAVTGLLRLAPFGFFGGAHLGVVPVSGFPRLLYTNMGWVFWIFVIAALVFMCRQRADNASGPENARLRTLLHRYGNGPLAHMATWDGNWIWFDPDSQGAIAYRIVGDVAITLGDPICDTQHTRSVVLGFLGWCDDQGYVPVFYSVRSSLRPFFAELGWYDLPVGEETIIRPRTFSMQGKKWQDVRSSVNRAAKSGLRAQWVRHVDIPASWKRQIGEISEQWVADKSLPEMGFTLGGLSELRDSEVRLMLAVTGDDGIDAVTSWLPAYTNGALVGWTLDFMRRRPESMNGVMEFVIASTILRAQEDDLDFVSLSAAPLVSANATSTPIDAITEFLSRTLEPAYGFRSLFAFKKKFQPEYQELIMAYPDPLALPRIGTALARAYLPDLSPRHLTQLLRKAS